MPTTYTDHLRFPLQGTGENPNTWGEILNAALELVDDAISGVVSVPVTSGATVTLTVANGAPDESRNAVIKLTGVATANIDVIIPNEEKIYIVHAGYTGNFTTTIKAVSGLGVAVSPGDRIILYCDGTNSYQMAKNYDNLGDLAFLDTITSSGLLNTGVVNTSAIATAAVTNEKLANGAVTTSILASGAVTTSLITGTYGQLLSFNSAGLGTSVAAGSVGQVLSVNSVGYPEFMTTPFKRVYESAEFPIDINTSHDFTHGLGVKPKLVVRAIRCKTAELGYSVGDEIPFASNNNFNQLTGTTWASSTQVGYRGGYNAAITVARRDAANIADINLSNWAFVLYAFA